MMVTQCRVGFYKEKGAFGDSTLRGLYRLVPAGQPAETVRHGTGGQRILIRATDNSNGVEGWLAWVDLEDFDSEDLFQAMSNQTDEMKG